jgi:DNA-directed RNA polymerase subunit A'
MYLMTRGDKTFSKKDVLRMLGGAGIEADIPDRDTITGKEIFSTLLPNNLNLEFRANCCAQCEECLGDRCKNDSWVSIKNGQLVTGTIDSKAIGAFKGKIISKLHGVVDEEIIKEFIDNSGRLAVSFLNLRGFSMGISDLDLPPNIMETVYDKVEKAEKDSNDLIKSFNEKKLKILPGLTAEQSLETQILNVLAQVLNDVSEIVDEHIMDSDTIVMANSGAKGSLINITQMAACVGQEAILGQRIKRGYMNRTLPHFKQDDLSVDAHGFVKKGFKQALSPTELFWNIMNGREGLMDKSLRTRKSGYMQRRLINALQDLQVNKDTVVKNSAGTIIQFKAGEDGIDPAKTERGDS